MSERGKVTERSILYCDRVGVSVVLAAVRTKTFQNNELLGMCPESLQSERGVYIRNAVVGNGSARTFSMPQNVRPCPKMSGQALPQHVKP